MDKAKRSGIRAGAMAEPERFAESVYTHTVEVNKQLDREYGLPGIDATEAAGAYAAASQILKPYLADTLTLLNDALDDGQHVFAEGAQATLLDIDFGTYPYVTSSSASIGGVCTGLGVPPKFISRTVGVTKAFTTRVGAGPFPTELFGDMGTRLRGTGANAWDEFGATTGRARRVGWLDAVVLRYVVRLNGISELALTKLDILTGLDELKIAVGYKIDGGDTRAYPQDAEMLARCEPIFQTLPGWHEDVRGVRTFAGLPANCTAYLRAIEAATGAFVTLASVGAERDQLILS